jgi:DNA-binding MarR family transcriptional regulator
MAWQSGEEGLDYVQYPENLSTLETLVLVTLAAFTDSSGRPACPSQRALLRRTQISKSRLQRVLHTLEHRGLIMRQIQPGRQGWTNYYLRVP